MFQIKMNDEYNLEVTQTGRGEWRKLDGELGYTERFLGFGGENEIAIQHTSDYRLCYVVVTYVGCAMRPVTKMVEWTSDTWGAPYEFEEAINKLILEVTGQNPDHDHLTWPYKEG